MIYLIQWLCASRHCSIAVVWDDSFDSKDVAVEKGEEIYRSALINRWCGICGGNIEPECKKTIFATMEEALTVLKDVELKNTLSRLLDTANGLLGKYGDGTPFNDG